MTVAPLANVGRFNDRTLLFGGAIAQLAMHNRPITVHERPDGDNSLFELRCEIIESLVLFKYATQAKSPWYFTLTRDQLVAVRNRHLAYPTQRRFLALICHLEGVCLLSLTEFDQIVPISEEEAQWGLSVSRPPRSQFRVSGPGRNRLGNTIARTRWVTEILSGYS